jgi:hypothetical protein
MVTAKPIYNCKGKVTDSCWHMIRNLVTWEGLSHAEVAKRFHCSQSTVTRVMHEDKPPSERTRIRSKDDSLNKRRKLLKAMAAEEELITGEKGKSGRAVPYEWKQPKYPSAYDMAREMLKRHNIKMSVSTVQRDLRAIGLVSYTVPKGPLTKQGDPEYRKKFCETMLREKRRCPNMVFSFSDEKYADTNRHGLRKQWKKRGDHPAPHGNIGRYAIKIHIWGIIAKGYRKLVFLPQKMIKSPDYLRYCVRPVVRELGLAGLANLTWVHDGARPHKGATTGIKNAGVTLLPMEWPARSPDLNPIETVWARVQRNVDCHRCTSAAGLKKAWLAEWNAIPQTELDALVEGFEARMKEVVKKNGAHIKFAGQKRLQRAALAKKAKAAAKKKR